MVIWILGCQGKQQSEDDVIGGCQFIDNLKDVVRMLKKDGKVFDILIGDLLIIKDLEIQNFLFYGIVSIGKFEIICWLVNYVCQCGDMVVMYDCFYEFVKSYYDLFIDKIFNFCDVWCVVWDLWWECFILLDFDNVVNILILMGMKEDLFWQGFG